MPCLFKKITFEYFGFDFDFLGVINTEVKPSIGACFELPADLNPKSEAIIFIQNLWNNCLRLSVIAVISPDKDHAYHEPNYVNSLIDDWNSDECLYDYFIKRTKKINVWLYKILSLSYYKSVLTLKKRK